MLGMLLRRMVESLIVLFAVAFIAFSLFSFIGDPVNNMLGQEATEAERLDMRERLGLNDSVIVQFTRFIGRAVQGEFGVSYRQSRPVIDLIAESLPATLELSFFAMVLAVGLGIPVGIQTAINRDSLVSKALMTGSLIGISLPTFLAGILLIMIFSVKLGWLPSFGRGQVVQLGWWGTGLRTWSGIKALILPTITLAIFQMTLIVRLVRSEMLEVLQADFIKFARARGLRERLVQFGYALPNTLVPVITIVGLQLGSVIAFAIVTETVFQWPGMGLLFIQSVTFADVPVMAAYLILIALIFVVINLLVDMLYYVIDPRLRSMGGL